MGPTLPTQDVYLRTAVNVGREGWAHFDHVRDEGLPVGHLPRRARPRTGGSRFGEHKGEPVWQQVPGEYRADLQRLIVIQGDTEPASVEQQRNLGATAPSPVRPAQPVPGQRRGGPAPVGDGLPAARLLRPGGPRGGRGAAAPQLRQRRRAADPRRVQRGDAGLAVVLHVHLLHRPGRQVPARHAEGVGVRPAVAAPASSCSRRRRTTCSSAPPASTGWWSAPRS